MYDALDEILGSRTPSGSEGIYNSSNNSNSYNINYNTNNTNNTNGGSNYNSSSNGSTNYNSPGFNTNTNSRTDYSGTGLGAGQSRGEYSNGQNDGRVDSNSNSNSNSRVFGSASDRKDNNGYTSLRSNNGDSNGVRGGGPGVYAGQGQGQSGSYQLKPDDYGYREYGDNSTEDTIL